MKNSETVPNVIGAGLPNVEIKRRLAGQFELHRRITLPQLILKRVYPLVKFGDQRLDGTIGGRESDENKCSARPAEENRIAQIETGDDSRNARLLSQCLHNGCQRLLALLRIHRWESLDHQDHAIDEGRTKTSGQLLGDNLRLAAFDAGCSLQMVRSVKRKWQERKDSGEDYTGQPEMAPMH